MTKMVEKACNQIKNEKERNAIMEDIEKVKEAEKEKEEKVEGSLVVDLEHVNGTEGQQGNRIRKYITNQEKSTVDKTNNAKSKSRIACGKMKENIGCNARRRQRTDNRKTKNDNFDRSRSVVHNENILK